MCVRVWVRIWLLARELHFYTAPLSFIFVFREKEGTGRERNIDISSGEGKEKDWFTLLLCVRSIISVGSWMHRSLGIILVRAYSSSSRVYTWNKHTHTHTSVWLILIFPSSAMRYDKLFVYEGFKVASMPRGIQLRLRREGMRTFFFFALRFFLWKSRCSDIDDAISVVIFYIVISLAIFFLLLLLTLSLRRVILFLFNWREIQ